MRAETVSYAKAVGGVIMKKINIKAEGYVHCKSNFYCVQDLLNESHSLSAGVNKLFGEIDSGNWAISYLLSMYKHRKRDFALFGEVEIFVGKDRISFDDLLKKSCYMDKSYPLFSSNKTVEQLVSKGLKKNKSHLSPEEIREIFGIHEFRFKRPLKGVGNDIFQAMAAIGFSYGKEIFCFPWLSKMRFDSYHEHLPFLLETLEKLNMTAIVPIGK